MKEAEICLILIDISDGFLILTVAVDNVLPTVSITKAMDTFINVMRIKYSIKRLGGPRRYHGWHFHYHSNRKKP